MIALSGVMEGGGGLVAFIVLFQCEQHDVLYASRRIYQIYEQGKLFINAQIGCTHS